ncbi:hypothetical protein ACN47E_004298 [Coniothyrium glycines]
MSMSRHETGASQLNLEPHGLLSLVDELLLNIIDHIDDVDRLCNLAAACSRLQALVEPYIWRNLVVLKGVHARRIALALDSRDSRVDFIQDISIRYQDDVRDGIEELNHWIGLMSKLRHLTIESPCPNNLEWQSGTYFDSWSRIDYRNLLPLAVYPRTGIAPAMPMLQTLTLHGHGAGENKFQLGSSIAMFRHPTIRNITLSCLNFEHGMTWEDFTKQGWTTKSTPLRSLILIECNVDVTFLDMVLSLPKALIELSIGERLHVFDGCEPSKNPSKRTSSPIFLTALQRQADSLRRLTHVGGNMAYLTTRETDPLGGAKLRTLVNLEHLELGIESHLYFYLRHNGVPPSLRLLKMLDTAVSVNAGQNIQSLSSVAFYSLLTLVTEHLPLTLSPEFVLHLRLSQSYFFRLLSMADAFEQQHLLANVFLDRSSIYKIARAVQNYNARFCISREYFASGHSYIPPYMYGEEVPSEKVIYNSDEFWRLNGIDYRVVDDEDFRRQLQGKANNYVCVQCKKRGFGMTDCMSAGDGSGCLRCVHLHQSCTWESHDTSASILPSSR